MYLGKHLTIDHVLMDGIQDMVFVIEVDHERNDFIYRYLNRAAKKHTGLDQDAYGKTIKELNPNETGKFLIEQYMKVVNEKDIVRYEDSYRNPNGEKKYSETTLTPFLDENNECTNIVAIVKDITEKKKAEFEREIARRKLEESIQRYQSLYNYNLDAVLTLDLNGYIESGNAHTGEITGYSLKQIVGQRFDELLLGEHKELAIEHFNKAVKGESQQFQSVIYNINGQALDIIIKFSPIVINGKVDGVYGVFKDISDEEKMIKKLQESEERFRIITENVHELITLLDDQGKIIYASPSYKDILGIDPKEYLGKLFLHNVHADDRMLLDQAVISSIKEGKTCKVQFRKYHQYKGWIWCELTGTPVFDDKGNFVNMVALTRDITLQKNYENSLKHFANHDTLTGLPNRRYFNIRLRKALNDLLTNQEGLAVMMVDIDDFKLINDRYGHDVGDDAVIEFANRLNRVVRDTDVVARLGGDEFVVLLNGITKKEEALEVAEKIHRAVDEPWSIKGAELNITTSIGIAIAPLEGTTRSQIMKQADIALYEAKQSGKNCIKIVE